MDLIFIIERGPGRNREKFSQTPLVEHENLTDPPLFPAGGFFNGTALIYSNSRIGINSWITPLLARIFNKKIFPWIGSGAGTKKCQNLASIDCTETFMLHYVITSHLVWCQKKQLNFAQKWMHNMVINQVLWLCHLGLWISENFHMKTSPIKFSKHQW